MEPKDFKRILEKLSEDIQKEINMAAKEQIRANADNARVLNAICDMNNEAVNAVRRVIKEVLE